MEKTNCLRNKKIVGLAGIFVGLNVLDATLTTLAIGIGGYELNPIMRYFLEQPKETFVGTKIGIALVFALILLLASTRFKVKRILSILVVCMTVICLFNGIGLLL